jgi:hypothetical protein
MFKIEPSSGGSDGVQDAIFIHVVYRIISHILIVSDTEEEYKI